MTRNKFLLRLFLFHLVLAFGTGGCLFNFKSVKNEQKEKIAIRQKHYQELHDTLIAQALTKGTSLSQIKERFGEPADIFDSGSTSGRFQVWTYEKDLGLDNQLGEQIRLYFDSDKLIDWKY